MMKTQLFSAATIAALTLASCGTGAGEGDTNAMDSAAMAPQEMTYTIDPAASTVRWAGTMVGIKTHEGSMPITGGVLIAKGSEVIGGKFVVNMAPDPTAMVDTFYNAEYTKDKLIAHLMSQEFFAADSFPTATFKITSASGNTATGELTVRGVTNQETVTDIAVHSDSAVVKASGKLVFNRQKYGVAWSSGSKDYVLSDDITLNVDLVGKADR